MHLPIELNIQKMGLIKTETLPILSYITIATLLMTACRSGFGECNGIVVSPQAKPFNTFSQLRENYRVLTIDSTDNIYLIYVMSNKDSTLHKIPSLKDSTACSNIKVGISYPFILITITEVMMGCGEIFSIRDIPHITTIDFHGIPITLEAAKVKDVRSAINVSGLYIH